MRGNVLEEDCSAVGAEEDWILDVLGLGWKHTELRLRLTGFEDGVGGLGFRRIGSEKEWNVALGNWALQGLGLV